MSGIPYIRFFGDDWLSGTQELSLEERGALVTIVALTSTTGSPPPADYNRLARRFGCTPGKAKKIVGSLADLGKIWLENGSICNKRAMIETEFSLKKSQKQTENANARWSKKTEKPNENKGTTDAMAIPRQCQPEPEPYIAADDKAREPDRTHRENLLEAMGHDQSGVTANGKLLGNQADMLEVNRWRDDLSLSSEEQLGVVAEVASKRSGQDPPASFRYFTKAMQVLSAQKQRPKLSPIEGGQPHEPGSGSNQRLRGIVTAAAEGTSRQDWG